MELIINSPSESGFLTEISFNFIELKTELENQLKKYKDRVYTDELIKDAKSDRAKLNTLKKALSDKRIAIKKKILEPYDKFEADIAVLTAMIDEPVLQISSGIEKYDQKHRDTKKALILDIYNSNIKDLKELLPFEKFFNEKMLNVTVKMSAISNEIISKIETINKDLAVIAELKSEFELQIKDAYLKNFDLSGALAEKSRLEEKKRQLAELETKRKAAEEEKKAKEEAKKQEIKPTVKPEPEQPELPTIAETVPSRPTPTAVFEFSFKVTETAEKLRLLKQFFVNNNISYERI